LYHTISSIINDPVKTPFTMKKGIRIKIKDTIKELNNSNALKKESVTRIAVSVNAENV
tara:strand:+ start:513 stop:686 length:174 start_codon:yes stop_codon:yes gene_type:complete